MALYTFNDLLLKLCAKLHPTKCIFKKHDYNPFLSMLSVGNYFKIIWPNYLKMKYIKNKDPSYVYLGEFLCEYRI